MVLAMGGDQLANTAKITDMVKTAMTCLRYMLFDIEVVIKRYSEI